MLTVPGALALATLLITPLITTTVGAQVLYPPPPDDMRAAPGRPGWLVGLGRSARFTGHLLCWPAIWPSALP